VSRQPPHDDRSFEGLPPGIVAGLKMPVDAYLRLSLADAQTLAASEDRVLRIGIHGRANLVSNRVRVDLDHDGRVRSARSG
jgi:hypothetical protein